MAGTPRPPLIQELEAKFEKSAKARRPIDIEWTLDAVFYGGAQYTIWSHERGQFETAARPKNRPRYPRPVANKIYHFVMDSWAKATEVDAAVEVLPTNIDSMEISNAKVAQAWLDHTTFATRANWEGRRDDGLFWTVLCGECWHKWTYDSEKKAVRIEACSPFEVYVDPTPADAVDARWIIHARNMDPDDVFDRYGAELPASSLEPSGGSRTKVLREVGLVADTPSVLVKELWELPSRRHPEGRFVVWAGNRILEQGAFPYRHKMLPFTQIGHSPIPGSSHFTSGVRAMRPLQMELNQYHAQKITARDKFANFKWFLDSALAQSMEERPNDEGDQVLVGDSRNGAMKPEILQAQMWPDSGDGEWITSEMQDAVGLHDASMGAAPGRVDSASGIEQLQDADKGRLSKVESMLGAATARGFAMLLELAKQYISEEQIIPDFSRSGAPSVHRFKTSAFPDNPMVRVVSGGGLPKNRAARVQQVTAWYAAGLLGQNPRKALEMMGVAPDMNITGEELDIMEAQQENMLMAAGIPVSPQKWQNHELHRRIHNEFRKTAEFDSGKQELWDMMEFHMQSTDVSELVEMREEAERQAHITATVEQIIPPAPAPEGAMLEGEPTPAPDGAMTAEQPEGQAPQPGA